MESKFKLPTETVELTSKGLLYPEDSALSSGNIEIKYMTAKKKIFYLIKTTLKKVL